MTTRQSTGITGRAISALGVRGDERRVAGWVTALFVATQSTHGLGANAADTLFFLRFGVEDLPKMIVLAGLAVMAMVLGHTVGLSYQGPKRWLPTIAGASALWVLGAWASVFLDTRLVYPVIWVSTQGIIMLTFTMMWNAAGAVCNTRQAKRLFPLFATAGVVGGVLGNLATGPIASLFGAPTLLLVQSGMLMLSTVLLMRIRRLMVDDSEEPAPVGTQMKRALGSIRASSLFKLAAVVAFAMWVLFYMVVFPFSESVATSFDTEADVAAFLGVFSSIATAATFVVSLLVAKRLFSRIGIVLSLMLVPAVYVGGFAVWLGSFNLATAAAVRGLQWVAVNAIGATAFTALFNVVTGRRRAQLVAFMTAVPSQLGTISGGLVLIVSQSMPDRVQFGIGLVIGVMALVVVVAMRPAYVDAILDSVRKGLVGVFTVPSAGLVSPVDAEARRILEGHLSDDRPEARSYALSALTRLQGADAIEGVTSYLNDRSPMVRATAFDVICDFDPEGFSNHAATALSDKTPEVRIRALHYAGANGSPETARGLLDDSDPRVRAAAAVIAGGEAGRAVAGRLIASGDPVARRALLNEIARWGDTMGLDISALLTDDDAEVRAAAVRAHAVVSPDPSHLKPLLDDPSLRVRSASAEALAQSHGGRRWLVETLQTGTVSQTDAALRALIPFDELTDDFVGWARNEAERAVELDRLATALGDVGSAPVAEFLHRVLVSRAQRLEQWVLMAMTTVDTEEVMPLVQRGVVADDIETKSQAVEALEAIGDRSVLEVLLPLLDKGDVTSDLDRREALRALTQDFDPWLRALATRCLAEEIHLDLERLYEVAAADDSVLVREVVPSLVPMPVEKSDTLSLMDRVLALQRASMFSELDPEDLELLAQNTTEVVYEPGELIYSEGAEGSEALMIVEGSAVVSVTRGDETRVINSYGPGDSVGELALLGPGVRSADVRAGDDGLHGVVITKTDFLSILEERPSVALGMLSTLASRLVEQT